MWLTAIAGFLIAGTVALTDALGVGQPAPGVRLTLTCETAAAPRIAVSDESGTFRFADVPPDTCSVTTDLQGFAPVTMPAGSQRDEMITLTFHLQTVALRSGLVVTGRASHDVPRRWCATKCRR